MTRAGLPYLPTYLWKTLAATDQRGWPLFQLTNQSGYGEHVKRNPANAFLSYRAAIGRRMVCTLASVLLSIYEHEHEHECAQALLVCRICIKESQAVYLRIALP